MIREGRPKESVSFVMRLWLESSAQQPPEWRWHVNHVQSGEQRYFRTLTDMLAFIGECAKVPPPQPLPSGKDPSGQE